MLNYITENRLKLPGPVGAFPPSVFMSPLTLRQIHRKVRAEAEKAEGKFCRPDTIVGKEGHASKIVSIGEADFVVEVIWSPDSILMNWQGETIKPLWRVRVVKDPEHKSRGIKDLSIYAPQYVRGKVGTAGPFQVMTANKDAIMTFTKDAANAQPE